jgi:hypothetical protein
MSSVEKESLRGSWGWLVGSGMVEVIFDLGRWLDEVDAVGLVFEVAVRALRRMFRESVVGGCRELKVCVLIWREGR